MNEDTQELNQKTSPSTNAKKNKTKFAKLKISKLNKFEHFQLIEYCKELYIYLEKKEKKLIKYKDKIKNLRRQIKKLELDARKVEILNDSSLTATRLLKKSEEDDPKNLVNDIIEAAESVQNKNGFVYEPTSGLYYDQSTGYYYNAEYGLYYNGDTGCYYKLNRDSNQFEFHSQVTSNAENRNKNDDDYDTSDSEYGNYKNIYKLPKKKTDKKGKIKSDMIENISKDIDPEDGEILTDEEDYLMKIDDNAGNESDTMNEDCHYQDVAKKYPPSLRIVVQETNVEKLKVGTLFIITFKGGSLGREGNHDVIIPDINISKFHLKFIYDETKKTYQAIDLGSRNGTILNGVRMSTAKQESSMLDIIHGSTLQLSQTKLLCHIHPGSQTCGLCEPGLIMNSKETGKINSMSHKDQLKLLQKKYGLENEKYKNSKADEKYNDRAADRRIKVGSSNHHEKTQIASTETAISSENKGFKMLSKLGWSKGDKLGKGNDGLLEPINLTGNDGTTGLGCTINPRLRSEDGSIFKPNKKDQKKTDTWLKAQERYKNISKTNIFINSDDTSDSD